MLNSSENYDYQQLSKSKNRYQLTTSFKVVPSLDSLLYADFGVSGSIRPVLWFLSRGSLSDKQLGSVEQEFAGATVTARTDVLRELVHES